VAATTSTFTAITDPPKCLFYILNHAINSMLCRKRQPYNL
jgi:hypothetical protein